jgi:predicted nucleic acid-binding protein
MSEFLVDSTVWIEFLRGNNPEIIDFISPLVDEDRISYNGIILSELLVGSNNQKEFSFIRDNFSGFKYLETDIWIFEKASELGFNLRKSGISIPLTDLIIAAHCIHYELTVVTADSHFKTIKKRHKLYLKFFR